MLGHRTLRSFRPGTERYTSLQQDDGSDPDVAEAAGQHSSDHFPSASTDRCSPTGSPSSEDSVSDQLAITPLPYATIMALCAGRFAEGLMFGVILPYINEMVHGMGVRQEDLGKWSAAAEAVMFVSGAIFAPFTAFLGDRFGRRWVYLIGLVLWGVGSIIFGIQETLLGVIISRSLGFAIFSPANTLGNTVGPVLGGLLASPVPSLLDSSWTLFVKYPYLLPSLVVGGFSWVVVIFAARYVPETNQKLIRLRTAKLRGYTDIEMPLISTDSVKDQGDAEIFRRVTAPSTMSTIRRLLGHGPFLFMMTLFALINPVTTAIDVVFPLFLYTELELGGMGLSVRTTGHVLGLSLTIGIPLNVILLPRMVRWLGRKRTIILSLIAYAVSILLLPIMQHSHAASEPSGTWTAPTVLLMTAYAFLRRIGDFTQTMLDALVLPSIDNPEDLATAASVTFSIRQMSRAIGLYAVSYIFAISAGAAPDGLLRQAWWIVFVLSVLPAGCVAWRMQSEGGAPWL